MPRDNDYWNPYRWVPVSNDKVQRRKPMYRHLFQGLSGRLDCSLEALTPIFIGAGGSGDSFIFNKNRRPYIPGTSLKGLVRSLVELVGNAAIPFPNGSADPNHLLRCAAEGEGTEWKLDVAARMFGYLNQNQVFAGLVRFSDATLREGTAKAMQTCEVVVGKPEPKHTPFYPTEKLRKFYHHHVEAKKLVPAPSQISQKRKVQPLEPGAFFSFTVDFENLGDEELALLLYCLVLEESVTVTLSKAALGPDAHGSVTITGPMRHKLGGCKPHGGGSSKITIDNMTLWGDRANRYRGKSTSVQEFDATAMKDEISRRTRAIVSRTDTTMMHLRAMMVYSADDPRKPVKYPSRNWFNQDKGTGTQLKPTL